MNLVERLRDWSEGPNTYKLTEEAANHIEALEAKVALTELALREAREALEFVKAYEKPFDDPYEDVCCAIAKINEVLK